MSEYQPTPKQEQAIREFLHEAVVPLIEDVLVKKLGQAMAYLKEQQQPEQEPVAWGAFYFGGKRNGCLYNHCETKEQIDAYIANIHQSDDIITLRAAPLYTAPPKREWVGYTNEDRERIVPMLVQSLINHDEKTMAGLLNAILIDIEQQLKEKNT